MIEFFVFFFILFAVLLGSNIYYKFLEESQKEQFKSSKNELPSSKIKIEDHNFFIVIAFVILIIIITLIMSFAFINLFTQNIFIFYMGAITFLMLTAFFYFILKSPLKLIYAILLSGLLIAVQIYLKIPLLGGLLLTFGYIGIVNYFMHKKILSPKIILIFLASYAVYDFVTVFITVIQPTLMSKTINDIFPAALIYGNTSMGIGDILFTLIMTSYSRIYFGLKIAILTGFLVSLPLIGLGFLVSLFPYQNIGLPYLVLSTPVFFALILILNIKKTNCLQNKTSLIK